MVSVAQTPAGKRCDGRGGEREEGGDEGEREGYGGGEEKEKEKRRRKSTTSGKQRMGWEGEKRGRLPRKSSGWRDERGEVREVKEKESKTLSEGWKDHF